MSDKDMGGAAFPAHGTMGEVVEHGMSLRDYFAAHAPVVPDDFGWEAGETDLFHRLFRWNYFYADGMIEERAN